MHSFSASHFTHTQDVMGSYEIQTTTTTKKKPVSSGHPATDSPNDVTDKHQSI